MPKSKQNAPPGAQDTRLLATIVEGKERDDLLIRTISYTESLGRMYQLEVVIWSKKNDIKLDELLGKYLTVRMLVPQANAPRFFGGLISRMNLRGMPSGLTEYRATVVPPMWLMTRNSDCRLFKGKKTKDIVTELAQDYGLVVEFRLQSESDYKTREYVVQYCESDFNFISRLLEEEGMYYYHEHENGKVKLVLLDDLAKHVAATDAEEVPFRQLEDESGVGGDVAVVEFGCRSEIRALAYAQQDFEITEAQIKTGVKQVEGPTFPVKSEIFEYPGEFEFDWDLNKTAEIRAQEINADRELFHGRTDHAWFGTGLNFKLVEHPRQDYNAEYTIISCSVQVTNNDYSSGMKGGGASYGVSFDAISSKRQFRPARTTPRPRINGIHTAVVVGEGEISVDELGRVEVAFHWDRAAGADKGSASIPVRVSQMFAGKQWGAIFTPRVGQEVIVEFVDGDPDRPLITGRVYNGVNKVPYALPGSKTISTIKTNSSEGGGGFNEIRFEDKKDEEQLFIFAQRQMDIRVQANCYESIGASRHLTVEKDQIEHIKNDRHETVDNDHTEEIGNDRFLTVAGKQATAVTGTLSLKVTGDVQETFEANHGHDVTGDYYVLAENICIEAKTNVTIKVGDSFIAIESGGITIGTSGTIELKSDGDTSVTAGANFKTESTANTEMKGTAGFKAETPATMDIKGSMVNIKGEGMAELASPMTTVKGDGMMTVKGGIVMIN